MKRIFLSLIIGMSGLLMALPLGNPADPKLLSQGVMQRECWVAKSHPLSCLNHINFRIGYYQDIVTNRNLAQIVSSDLNQDTLESNLHTYAAYLAANICGRFDIFTTLGTSSYSYANTLIDWSLAGIVPNENGQSWVYSNNDFSWSVGGRLIAFECGALTFGVEGQYLHARPKISYLSLSSHQGQGVPIDYQLVMGSSGMATNYREWQVGLGVAYQSGWMVPYVGVKWSSARLNMGDPVFRTDIGIAGQDSLVTLRELEQSKTWGFAVGDSFVFNPMMDVTIEGRFGDEVGFMINGQIGF